MDQLECDVLIVGSGAAGLMCLDQLDPSLNVIIVSKRNINEGSTYYAQGGVACVFSEEDSFESHIEDTLYAGAGLCDEQQVKYLIENGPKAMYALAEFIEFDRDKNNQFKLGKEGAHRHRRILHCDGDATGKAIQLGLLERAKNRDNTRLIEDYRIIKLLCEDNHCWGALAWDHKRHVFVILRSKTIVLASGGYSYVYQETTNPWKSSGDGIALALRAGATIKDMEFTQFHPTALFIAGLPRFLISEAVRGEGAFLRNADGELFMENYHKLKELAPRDVVSRAISQEMVRTNQGCVFLDLSHLPTKKTLKRFPNINATCKSYGLDISKQWIPVRPAAHYTMGGIKVNQQGETGIKNLYACGEVACSGAHGANRLASNSLLEAVVYGKSVAEHINGSLPDKIKNIRVRPRKLVEDKLDLNDIVRTIQSTLWRHVGVYRNKENLTKTYKRLQTWSEMELNLSHNVETYYDFKNICKTALLITKPALLREESRGAHYRSDFTKKDDQNFLKSIELQKQDIQ